MLIDEEVSLKESWRLISFRLAVVMLSMLVRSFAYSFEGENLQVTNRKVGAQS